jgi:hypothetical protein
MVTFRTALLVGVLYGAAAIVWTYPLARHPSELAAIAYDQSERSPRETSGGWGPIVRNDQLLSIALPTRNANSLLQGRIAALIDNGLCFPLHNAAAFGEHMLEFSLLMLPAYALTGDPLFSYNVACLLQVMLLGMTYFALLRYWTSDPAASFIAGALLVFHPWRLDLFAHPALVSLHWMPLVLLYFERLLRSPSWRYALLLAVTATLQMLTASYLAITFALFASAYGTVRMLGERQHVRPATLALLIASVVGAGLTLVPVLVPYVDAQNTWFLARSADSTTTTLRGLLPGGAQAIGVLPLLLAIAALIRSSRFRARPVGAILAGSSVCFALSVRVPAMEAVVGTDSLYDMLRDHLALLAMIRVPALLRVGGYFGVTLLAGIGLARLLRHFGPRTRSGLVVATAAAAAVELFYTPATALVYQATPRVVMRELRPPAGVLEAYAALDGDSSTAPILDLPFLYTRIVKGGMAEYVLFSAYHLRPTAACYNSFFGAVYENVGRIAERYWSGGPPDELLALGFHDLAVHDPEGWLHDLRTRKQATMAARTDDVIAARIEGQVQTHDDMTRLRPGPLELGRAPMPPHSPGVFLQVTNESEAVWKLAPPFRPFAASVTWAPADESTSPIEMEGSVLPPLALAAGRTDSVAVAMTRIPPPGAYRLTVAIPDLHWVLNRDVVIRFTEGAAP